MRMACGKELASPKKRILLRVNGGRDQLLCQTRYLPCPTTVACLRRLALMDAPEKAEPGNAVIGVPQKGALHVLQRRV